MKDLRVRERSLKVGGGISLIRVDRDCPEESVAGEDVEESVAGEDVEELVAGKDVEETVTESSMVSAGEDGEDSSVSTGDNSMVSAGGVLGDDVGDWIDLLHTSTACRDPPQCSLLGRSYHAEFR